jgi:predicted nucleic acid-binding protein
MTKSKVEFLIENDIMLDHLSQKDTSIYSDLEIAMSIGICFTSAINVAELYFNTRTLEEKNAVNSVMFALKILGIHPRYSLTITEFFNKVTSVRDALICSVAKFNKLPILTNEVERFQDSGIKIISSNELRGQIDIR